MLSLARVCMNAYTAPQEATAAPAPLVVPVAPAQPAQPAPVVACPEPGPQTPAERLQHLARSKMFTRIEMFKCVQMFDV